MMRICLSLYAFLLYTCSAYSQTTTVNYSTSTADMANPERGIYHFTETHSNAYTPVNTVTLQNFRTAEGVTLIYRIFNLEDFTSSPISAAYLTQMQTDFNRIRAAGIKCIARFAYTDQAIGWPPTSPYGDATKAWMLQHIAQLEPYLQSNSDIIALVQTGFIGIWGEWYYTTYFGDPLSGAPTATNYADRKEVVDRLLAALPVQRTIQVRTPYYKYHLYRGNVLAPIGITEAYNGSTASRIGHHNDCFLASSTDFGTYVNTTTEYPYLSADTRYTPMGGETCELNSPRSDCGGDATNELSYFHWSFLNRDYINTVWNSWIAQGCSLQIKKSLGYRLQLNSGTYSTSAKPGGSFDINLSISNVGWAAPFNPRLVEIILENISDGTLCKARLTDDPRFWLAGTTTVLNYQIGIPANYVNGNYKVYLSLPDPMTSLYENSAYSIQLANSNTTWNATKGYNYLAVNLNINSAYVSPNYSGSLWFDNCYGALPLTWLSFNAALENKNVNLNWTTTKEINHAYFVVEHSNDGFHFSPIHKIENNNQSSQNIHDYAFTDTNANTGANYYRIAQYDFDGAHTYSSIETVNISSPQNYSIAPNPFKESTFLYCDKESAEPITLSIVDVQGNILFSESKILFGNATEIGRNLASGVYFLKVTSKTQTKFFRIVKL